MIGRSDEKQTGSLCLLQTPRFMGSEEKQPSVRGGCGSRVLWENPAQRWRSFSQRRDCRVASVDDHGGDTHGAPRDGFERLGCHWLGQGQ